MGHACVTYGHALHTLSRALVCDRDIWTLRHLDFLLQVPDSALMGKVFSCFLF